MSAYTFSLFQSGALAAHTAGSFTRTAQAAHSPGLRSKRVAYEGGGPPRPMSAYSVAICSCAYLPLLACACLSAVVSSAPAASAPRLQSSSDTTTETGVWVPDILTTTLPSPV